MNDENKGSNPKLIVAVQMLCIGIVLLILGTTVILISPVKTMTPLFRLWSWTSNGSIVLSGAAFAAGGLIRYKRAKP